MSSYFVSSSLPGTRFAAWLWVAVMGLAASTANAVTPAELLTAELERRPIQLSQLSGGQLSYFDDQRRLAQSPAAEFVRLSIAATPGPGLDTPPPSAEVASPMLVELVDGQRLAGRWSGAARDGEAIVWVHPTLGRFTLGLDEIRRVTRVSAESDAEPPAVTSAAEAADGDVLIMNNGDRLLGFVLEVGEGSVTLQPDGAANGLAFAVGDLAELRLANPVSPVPVAGDLLRLTDGSLVRGTGVTITSRMLRFTPTLADAMLPVERPLSTLRSVDFAASGLRLMDLTDRPMEFEAGTAFGRPVVPRVVGRELWLRAPTTLRFDLPTGVRRFAAEVALNLADDLPAERTDWANVGFSVGYGDHPGVPQRWVLDRERPRVFVNLPSIPAEGAPAKPGVLVLTVDPAANGPVLDRLRIADAVLLVEQAPIQPGSEDPDR